ncbi:glyoxalase superfamily protein [Ensifer sp. YR511]|uniref:glyoxalase superfamily protein n=1 Tax=Ensifer sp. YR511 TaxID=1855294 RepID=UPI00088C239E|nr:glyoxalase superfamily protein [Ensifer sp. YR511]SDN97705.1 hypothetical protein SAMN05216328_14533 [Ensifer sp. YR511]
MNTYRDAKRMAKVLEACLAARNVEISHGESLDIIARQFGVDNWNTLSARLKRERATEERRIQALQSWHFIGEHPTEFDHGADENAFSSGRRAALIHFEYLPHSRYRDTKRVFGCLLQQVSPVPYRGQRIEIVVELASKRVTHGATVWARVDKSPGISLPLTTSNIAQTADGFMATMVGQSAG